MGHTSTSGRQRQPAGLSGLEQIEVDVQGFFTTHHRFKTEAGMWAKLTFPAFADEAKLSTNDGRMLRMRKTHWLGSAHELLDGGIVRGMADRRGLFHRELVLQFDGQEYMLVPEGLLSQGWYLTDTQDNTLLAILPRGILRQGAYLTVTGAIPVELVAFAYYLVFRRQQEDAAAVAATSGAAAS